MNQQSRDFWKNWSPFMVNIAILMVMALLTYRMKEIVREELKNYVSHDQFRAYQSSHKDFSDEVIRSFNQQFAELKSQTQRISESAQESNNMIREMRGELRVLMRGSADKPGPVVADRL